MASKILCFQIIYEWNMNFMEAPQLERLRRRVCFFTKEYTKNSRERRKIEV
jgi:phosphatidylserine decarboxylase